MPDLSLTRPPLRGAAVTAAVALAFSALATGAQANSRTTLTRMSLNRISTTAYGHAYSLGGFVAVPASWSAHRSESAIRLRDRDFPRCVFNITITAQAVQSGAATPADQITAQQAVDPRYVIDSGTRGRGAWRVVRQPGGSSAGTTVIGDLLVPVPPNQPSDAPKTWVGLHAVASAAAGTVCHSGMYRQTVGPQIGDAFASYRGIIRG